tara:strand:+ start:927 stop:1676 length:750 start_codon:yes stop_codon:yes gene_type:complete
MEFFKNLPNVYVGEGIADTESFRYRLVKNIFRRAKTRPDLDKFITSFEAYELADKDTPSRVAAAFLGNIELDWVILLTNNIIDFYEEWPKPENELRTYVQEKYDNPDGIHHYETNEILYNGITVIKQGIEVNKIWRTVLPDGTTKNEEESIYPVSNYEHEEYLNEKKRLIRIPNQEMSNLIVEEFENLVAYEPHAELDNANNKKTPLSISARFLDITGYVTGSISVTDIVGTVSSYDNGPGSTTIKVAS